MTNESAGTPTYHLDHVCLAVRKIAPARAMLERMLGYSARTAPITNTRQQVTVQFMEKLDSIDIKLIEPSSPASPLVEFVKSRGGGLHHLAFKTEAVLIGIRDLESKGAKLLTQPEPGEAFCDSLIAFAFLGSGLNIELIDTDLRLGESSEVIAK